MEHVLKQNLTFHEEHIHLRKHPMNETDRIKLEEEEVIKHYVGLCYTAVKYFTVSHPNNWLPRRILNG